MYALQSFKGWFYSSKFTQPLKYFKVRIPFLTLHTFDFWLAEKSLEPTWKSKTGPVGPVPLPLVNDNNKADHIILYMYHNKQA